MKKGVMFTASVAVFLMTLLVFTVVVYRNTEESEIAIMSNSYTNRMLNLEDSFQQTVKKIYEVNQKTHFSAKALLIDDIYYDKTEINTILLSDGSGNADIAEDLDDLKILVEESLNSVEFDAEKLSNDLSIELDNGVKYSKEDSTAIEGERIIIEYDWEELHDMNLSFSSNEDIQQISCGPCPGSFEYPTFFSSDDYILTVVVNDLNAESNPEGIDDIKSYNLNQGSTIYTFELGDGSDILIKLTFEQDRIVIDNLQGDYDLDITFLSKAGQNSQKFRMAKDVALINISEFKVYKKVDIEFS